MKLEKMIRNAAIPAAIITAPNTVYADETQTATYEQLVDLIVTNDHAVFPSKENAEDWYHQKKLIESGDATVLIQPVKDHPGYCEYGLDGFPQKYALPADARTKDGKLEKAEMILNGTDKTFLFPCNLQAEETAKETAEPIFYAIPGPKETVEKIVSDGTFSAGAGYLNVFTAEDKISDFTGEMQGGNIFLTYQPRFTNWYFGAEALGYGNYSSNSADLESSAADGPLAGQLVMKGRNDYSLETFGVGIGGIFGYQFKPFGHPFENIGIEFHNGIMHDWTVKEFTESSAQYINGNIVEGTGISNNSDNTDTQLYGYAQVGLRIRLPYVCLTPAFGLRTDFSSAHTMGSASVGYCSAQE